MKNEKLDWLLKYCINKGISLHDGREDAEQEYNEFHKTNSVKVYENDIKLLEEAKRRGFVKGADCTTPGGTEFVCNEVITGNTFIGHLFNSSNGFFMEMIFDAESGLWADVNN